MNNKKLVDEFENLVLECSSIPQELQFKLNRLNKLRETLSSLTIKFKTGRKRGRTDKVIEFMSVVGESTAKEVSEKLSISESNAATALSRAVKLGLLKRVKRGVYAIANNHNKNDIDNIRFDESTGDVVTVSS